jgi:hypothetical protein
MLKSHRCTRIFHAHRRRPPLHSSCLPVTEVLTQTLAQTNNEIVQLQFIVLNLTLTHFTSTQASHSIQEYITMRLSKA